ncbi:hypothetical protein L0N00_17180, partial [Eggerthella lenta]|nr:hypothetical protein [Eggerthella lenta]
ILREASSHLPYHYEIIKNRVKQDAVLSVCETGIGTAEKISNLMEASLPDHVSISVIPYDFDSLIKTGRSSSVFEKYNIL